MVWLLMLHIATLLMWCAALLYMPVLVLTAPTARAAFFSHDHPLGHPPGADSPELPSIERFVFTHIATPFALLAIVAGTLVFLWNSTREPWLILKLTAVVGLVICHALVGLLILRAEPVAGALPPPIRRSGCALLLGIGGLVVTILWLVLAKPALGWDQ